MFAIHFNVTYLYLYSGHDISSSRSYIAVSSDDLNNVLFLSLNVFLNTSLKSHSEGLDKNNLLDLISEFTLQILGLMCVQQYKSMYTSC